MSSPTQPPSKAASTNQDRHGPLPTLLFVLTAVTGLVDAVSYLQLGHVFVANMTGNVVFLGFAASGAAGFSAAASLVAIAAFLVEPAPGPQQFSKVGTRNAMVIAVCSFALALDPSRRRVGTGIGSAGPTPLRAAEAESFIQGELDWENRARPSDAAMQRFGELVAAAAKPIEDVRGTADYRRHALGVMARRCLAWCWAA